MLQQNSEAAGRNHEQAQTRSFDQIFRPVTAGGRDRARKPGSVCAVRLGPGCRLLVNSACSFRLHSHIGFTATALVTNERGIYERRELEKPVSPFPGTRI